MERCPSPAMQAAMDDAAGGKRSPATPYALALAAITSVESPFVHVDSLKGDDAASMADKAVKQARDRQQQRARAAHAKFRSPRGDALSALLVLTAFEAAGAADTFCRCSAAAKLVLLGAVTDIARVMSQGRPADPAPGLCTPHSTFLARISARRVLRIAITARHSTRRDNFMVAKNLREAVALHRQLRRVVEGLPPDSDPALPLARLSAAFSRSQAAAHGGAAALPDPPVAVMNRLQRAVAAGWADQVRSLQRTSPDLPIVCVAEHGHDPQAPVAHLHLACENKLPRWLSVQSLYCTSPPHQSTSIPHSSNLCRLAGGCTPPRASASSPVRTARTTRPRPRRRAARCGTSWRPARRRCSCTPGPRCTAPRRSCSPSQSWSAPRSAPTCPVRHNDLAPRTQRLRLARARPHYSMLYMSGVRQERSACGIAATCAQHIHSSHGQLARTYHLLRDIVSTCQADAVLMLA